MSDFEISLENKGWKKRNGIWSISFEGGFLRIALAAQDNGEGHWNCYLSCDANERNLTDDHYAVGGAKSLEKAVELLERELRTQINPVCSYLDALPEWAQRGKV